MKICPGCGYQNADTAVFCANCNALLLSGGNQNTAGMAGGGSSGAGPARLWSFRTSLLLTAVLVVAFTACSVALFDCFSGTTVGNIFRGISDGIRDYYDNVKLF